MSKRLSYNYVKSQFEKEGYTLLTKEYKNSYQKLKFICPNGHKHSISWGAWSQGQRCAYCSNRVKKTIEEVREFFEKEGYILLSKEYKNAHQKLNYICPNNHKHSISWHMFEQGRRCPYCAKCAKKTIEEVREAFEKEGYILLTKKYKNAHQKLTYRCPRNHLNSITWNDWKHGNRCPYCSGNIKKTIVEVEASFESEGYTLLTNEYKNAFQKLEYICPKGHKHSINWSDWTSGYRCPYCANVISKPEREIISFLKPYFPDVINNDRTLIKPLELDIVIPSKKLAIEYCGLYWHSEEKRSYNYHLDKLNKCNEAGYRLITIFEDEWIFRREIVKSRLSNLLALGNGTVIYARNCQIKEIDNRFKDLFLEQNHLQGNDYSSIRLGAFYNDELVSVMTFTKFFRQKNILNSYELMRFCSKINYRVVGIASKLLKYFINNYKPKYIISYGDRRWSDGDLYKILGFKFVHNTKPSYWYVVGNKRFHKANFRLNRLNKKLKHFDPNLTEYQNMLNNGYQRIYDCGNSKWVLTI